MNLLLLIYAMLAGLAGVNVGPSTLARTTAVAEAGQLAPMIAKVAQASLASKAMAARAAMVVAHPVAPMADARRVARLATKAPAIACGRATPERRRE